jgi:hypothetical protein
MLLDSSDPIGIFSLLSQPGSTHSLPTGGPHAPRRVLDDIVDAMLPVWAGDISLPTIEGSDQAVELKGLFQSEAYLGARN